MNSAPARENTRKIRVVERSKSVFEDANFRLKVMTHGKKRKVVRDVNGKEIDQSQPINFLYASTTSDCD